MESLSFSICMCVLEGERERERDRVSFVSEYLDVPGERERIN